MYTHTTLTLPSGPIAHNWKPSGPSSPRAILILQHGFGEYAQRYATSHSKFIPRLTDRGIEVWALDLQGHGRSPGVRGVVDLQAAVRDHVWLVGFAAGGGAISTGVTAATASVGSTSDNARINPTTPPILLFGHSLGGLVTAGSATTLLTASQKSNNPNPTPTPRITGLLLTSPVLPFFSQNQTQSLISHFASLLLRIIAFFFPHREVPSLPGSTPPPHDTLRGDHEAVRLAEEDQMLFRGGISWVVAASAVGVVRGVWGGIREGLWGQNGGDGDGDGDASDIGMNVLVLHGRWDPWSDWRGSLSFVEGIQRFRTQAACAKGAGIGKQDESESEVSGTKLVILDTPYHELLSAGGSTGEEVLRVMLEWIEARTAQCRR